MNDRVNTDDVVSAIAEPDKVDGQHLGVDQVLRVMNAPITLETCSTKSSDCEDNFKEALDALRAEYACDALNAKQPAERDRTPSQSPTAMQVKDLALRYFQSLDGPWSLEKFDTSEQATRNLRKIFSELRPDAAKGVINAINGDLVLKNLRIALVAETGEVWMGCRKSANTKFYPGTLLHTYRVEVTQPSAPPEAPKLSEIKRKVLDNGSRLIVGAAGLKDTPNMSPAALERAERDYSKLVQEAESSAHAFRSGEIGMLMTALKSKDKKERTDFLASINRLLKSTGVSVDSPYGDRLYIRKTIDSRGTAVVVSMPVATPDGKRKDPDVSAWLEDSKGKRTQESTGSEAKLLFKNVMVDIDPRLDVVASQLMNFDPSHIATIDKFTNLFRQANKSGGVYEEDLVEAAINKRLNRAGKSIKVTATADGRRVVKLTEDGQTREVTTFGIAIPEFD